MIEPKVGDYVLINIEVVHREYNHLDGVPLEVTRLPYKDGGYYKTKILDGFPTHLFAPDEILRIITREDNPEEFV